MSCVSMMSFTPKGKPCSGPRGRLARAVARTRFGERSFGIEKCKRVHGGIARGDAFEARPGQRLGGKTPGRHRRQGVDCSQFVRGCAIGNPCDWAYPMLTIADNIAVAAVATAIQGECRIMGLNRRGIKSALAAGALAIVLAGPTTAHAQSVLRLVPQADLKILDTVQTTNNITRNHGYMIYDTLFAMDSKFMPKPQMVESYTRSADGLT